MDPVLFVIAGATGDLARRKLFPAIARLLVRQRLPSPFLILGVARNAEQTDEGFRAWAREELRASGASPEEAARWCDDCLFYQPVREGTAQDYGALRRRIEEIERAHRLPGNRVYYLALPPAAFPDAIRGLGEAGLARSPGWTRLVVEKPFGRDLESAVALNQLSHRCFDESQIFRIDHYLGKETVQNLLVFRFSNAIFESLWNRSHIARVLVTVAEPIGVESRAGYYEEVGALRDMIQNHVTQVVSLVGMEVPAAYDAGGIRDEKVKLLRSVQPIDEGDVVFGQYEAGRIDGREVRGYREEPGVAPDSQTETFVALKLLVDNWRWQGVPFCVRTGKRLPEQLTEIRITFRRPPVCLFRSLGAREMHANVLRMTLQPHEGFSLFFDVKPPGDSFALQSLPLQFAYRDAFGPLPDAYETLILEVLEGDQTHFVAEEWLEASWALYTPLLRATRQVHRYPSGTWGPPEAARVLGAWASDAQTRS
jgi:glucose-6-phosphate 1-dehydrogenase